MIRVFLIALLAMGFVTAVAILAAVLQGRRAKKAEAEANAQREAFRQVKEKAERLQKTLNATVKIEEAANAERKDLKGTADAGLVDRANSLFNVRDGGKRQ
jgi:uncharacterized protein YpmS